MNAEQILFLLVLHIFLLPLLIIGIILCCGKGADLIAGFNTSSQAEKAKWNEKALCRGTGVLVLGITVCIEISLLGGILDRLLLVWGGIALVVLFVTCGLLYINKSKRFRK